MSDLNWKLESVSNEDGTILSSSDTENTCDSVICKFDDDDNISIINKENGKSWSGKYALKLTDGETESFELDFSDGTVATGIFGKRIYKNQKAVYSFVIYTDNQIVSFLSEA